MIRSISLESQGQTKKESSTKKQSTKSTPELAPSSEPWGWGGQMRRWMVKVGSFSIETGKKKMEQNLALPLGYPYLNVHAHS